MHGLQFLNQLFKSIWYLSLNNLAGSTQLALVKVSDFVYVGHQTTSTTGMDFEGIRNFQQSLRHKSSQTMG